MSSFYVRRHEFPAALVLPASVHAAAAVDAAKLWPYNFALETEVSRQWLNYEKQRRAAEELEKQAKTSGAELDELNEVIAGLEAEVKEGQALLESERARLQGEMEELQKQANASGAESDAQSTELQTLRDRVSELEDKLKRENIFDRDRELQKAAWGLEWQSGAPNGRLGLQMAVWSSKWPSGAPNGRLGLQMAVWSSKWPFGAPDGHLEPQDVPKHTKTNTNGNCPDSSGSGQCAKAHKNTIGKFLEKRR